MNTSIHTPGRRKAKSARASLLLSMAAAASLALAACGGGAAAPDAESGSTTGAGQEIIQTKDAKKEPAAAPAKEFTEAELTTLLTGIKDAKGNP